MNGSHVLFNARFCSCEVYFSDHVGEVYWAKEQPFIARDLRGPVRIPRVIRNTMSYVINILKPASDHGMLIGKM